MTRSTATKKAHTSKAKNERKDEEDDQAKGEEHIDDK